MDDSLNKGVISGREFYFKNYGWTILGVYMYEATLVYHIFCTHYLLVFSLTIQNCASLNILIGSYETGD